MSKVQEYLEKKRIAKLGLPKLWVVKSTKETGVDEPYEIQVKEINNDMSCSNVYIYKLDDYPYEINIEDGAKSGVNHGYGSVFGDLWSWTIACFFLKEDAYAFYETEKRKLENKPLLEAIKVVASAKPFNDTLNKFAREKYNEKFKDTPTPYNAFHFYSGFIIINKNTLEVKYTYGAGDIEYDDSFTVTIH